MRSVYSSKDQRIEITNDDVLNLYDKWHTPTIIISDGPYGLNGFDGDPATHDKLGEWYEPHIIKWSEKATAQTTLWFWNSEVGWATVHPTLIKHGWEYVNCHVWNKGLSHIAGNANSKSLRQLPIVTELCVQYVKKPIFRVGNQSYSMKDWLRHEWVRTGLPFSKTNEAAGVKNAATRKYFTKCHLWYSPPSEVFEKISLYANKHGEVVNKPFFAVDGRVLSKKDWDELRAKFKCPIGVTNVWNIPPLNGKERVKKGNAALHLNQKPLEIMKLILEISSDEGDVCWEPFGGLCSAAIAAHRLSRYCHAAEINKEIFDAAVERFKKEEEASNESTK